MPDLILNSTTQVLGKVLDGAAARQRALASNIANVETPGYQRKELQFEGQLRELLSQPSSDPEVQAKLIDDVSVEATADSKTPVNANGNNVAIEQEMVAMAKNSLQYETSAQLLNMELSELRNAIHEGRR